MSNLQEIKDLVSIRAVADYLGLEEEYGKRKFPGERTASIQLYKDNRFHDFGRNVNGDIFDLMIHVRGCTLKEAIAELKTAFNIRILSLFVMDFIGGDPPERKMIYENNDTG